MLKAATGYVTCQSRYLCQQTMNKLTIESMQLHHFDALLSTINFSKANITVLVYYTKFSAAYNTRIN